MNTAYHTYAPTSSVSYESPDVLTCSKRKVYEYILFLHTKFRRCFLAVDHWSNELGISRSQVYRDLNTLKQRGLIAEYQVQDRRCFCPVPATKMRQNCDSAATSRVCASKKQSPESLSPETTDSAPPPAPPVEPPAPVVVSPNEKIRPEPLLTPADSKENDISARLRKHGVAPPIARNLSAEYTERCLLALKALAQEKNVRRPERWLYAAITQDWQWQTKEKPKAYTLVIRSPKETIKEDAPAGLTIGAREALESARMAVKGGLYARGG